MCTNPINIYEKKTDIYVKVGCKHCTECMQIRANEWAVRGHFELQQKEQNCFITLTYENNPIVLHKEHMQKFIKRLRKNIEPLKIKYFSCGEYGDKKMRPHYHIIIFGYDFQDKTFWKMSQSEKPIYISHELDDLWQYGIATVQEANATTISYSAKYSAHLKTHLPDHLKNNPEYNTMSQNLGIDPILKKIETYLLTDQIYINGFSYKIPKIVLEKHFKKQHGVYYQDYVNNYHEEMSKYKIHTPEQNKTRARLAQKKILHTQLREL